MKFMGHFMDSPIFRLLFCTLAAVLTASPFSDIAAEPGTEPIVIIGHKTLPVDNLSKTDLKLIFKGERTLWPENQPILFVLQNGGELHETFVKQYLRKTPVQYSRYWKKLVFSGRGFPPTTLKTEADVITFVEKTPGAVGYVSRLAKLAGVKRIRILEDE